MRLNDDGAYKTTISKEEINELPIDKFKGTVFYLDNKENLQEALSHFTDAKVLGFDTETRPSFKKGKVNKVSLLQLSTKDKAMIIRLNKIGLPKEIVQILANPKVYKIGVAINDDISGLRKLYGFEPAGFIDLQSYVNKYGIEDNALKKITAIVLGFKISKRQQTSNWEAEQLSQAQIEYAATDAWVCHEIYTRLNNQ